MSRDTLPNSGPPCPALDALMKGHCTLRAALYYNALCFERRRVQAALDVLKMQGWRNWSPQDTRNGLGRRILRDKTVALIWHDRILNNRSL